jgi:hypothetical protein
MTATLSPDQNAGKLSRNRFNVHEDFHLLGLVQQYGRANWAQIAARMPGRTARQCRDRYNNYLYGDVARAPWTAWEDDFIARRQGEVGARWSLIAREMRTGRTALHVKNRWTKHLRRDRAGHGAMMAAEADAAPQEGAPPEPVPDVSVFERMFVKAEHRAQGRRIICTKL